MKYSKPMFFWALEPISRLADHAAGHWIWRKVLVAVLRRLDPQQKLSKEVFIVGGSTKLCECGGVCARSRGAFSINSLFKYQNSSSAGHFSRFPAHMPGDSNRVQEAWGRRALGFGRSPHMQKFNARCSANVVTTYQTCPRTGRTRTWKPGVGPVNIEF